MFFRRILERLQALFCTLVASRFETDALLTFSEQKAELLHQADKLERDGAPEVAAELRQQADRMSLENPAATAVPAMRLLENQLGSEDGSATAALPSAEDRDTTDDAPAPRPRRRRRQSRSS